MIFGNMGVTLRSTEWFSSCVSLSLSLSRLLGSAVEPVHGFFYVAIVHWTVKFRERLCMQILFPSILIMLHYDDVEQS